MILPYNEYQKGMTREICHAVRDRNISAIAEMAKWYVSTNLIDENAVLIPLPQHEGKADYTLEICKLIQRETDCKICDILKRIPSPSLYEQKKKGMKAKTLLYLDTKLKKPEGKNIFLIDNISASGLTMNDGLTLIPNATALPYSYSWHEVERHYNA